MPSKGVRPGIRAHPQSTRKEASVHLGLIGGIGIAATIVYYQRLAAAMTQRGGAKLDLTIVHGDIQELIHNNLADRREAQAQAFLPLLRRLKDAGCGCAALTSLGAHFCLAELSALSPLPVVSGVAPLDAYFAERGIRRIGLLGTRVVMRTRLYGQLARTEALALDEDIEVLGQTYQEVAVAGRCEPEQRDLFLDAGRRMMAAGAEAIVLAGTDLNLAFDGHDPGYPVIDALDVHVDLLADLAAGRLTLETLAHP
jgi:aspartate racemase